MRDKAFDDERQHRTADDIDFVLRVLARENHCSFLSDLQPLFREGRLSRDAVSVRGHGLPVWDGVVSYLAGTRTSFASHDEVERAFSGR